MTRAAATTLVLQLLMQVLTLTFGVAGLYVARTARAGGRDRGWLVTGLTFTVLGSHALVQALAAFWATAEGEGSRVYETFMRWLPPANDARIAVVLGYAVLLLAHLLFRRPLPSRPLPILAVLAALLAAGTLAGLLEGGFRARVHYTVLAVVAVATVVVLFAVLYQALVTSAFDYLLWTAMAVYAMREAVSANFFSAFAWLGVERVWQPSFRTIVSIGLASLVLMIACSLLRLRLARAGVEAPSLMERLRA